MLMKKFFAGLLASIMLMSVLFVPAFAASANTDTPSFSLMPYNQAEKNYELQDTATEDTVTFRICPDKQQSERTVAAYINVSLKGGNKAITASVWKVGEIGNHNLTITLYHGNTPTSLTTNNDLKKTTNNVGTIGNPTSVSSPVTKTQFWKAHVEGYMTLYGERKNVNYDTYIFLHNKLGNRYPSYTDSRSKKSVTVPESAVWPVVAAANRDSWTTSQRSQYRTWYEKTYNNGNSMDWTDIQIHHIKPLKYGGKSVNSNLIPLPKATHTQFTTWWAKY